MTSRTVGKVLLIDDSEVCCEATKAALEQRDFHVTVMTTPFGFVNTLRREQPVAVLVDVTMPAMSGPKLIKLAREKRIGDCPIILYSDRSEDELRVLVASCGADGYIRKSLDLTDLAKRIREVIAKHPNRG